MSSGIILPGSTAPSNLRLADNVRAIPIDSDLYDICERVKQISPKLRIVQLDNNKTAVWMVLELCEDNVERKVLKTDALDGRVLKRLEYIMGVPFEHRYKMLEEENRKYEAQYKEDALDKLYEDMGRPMWTQLERDGFIDGRNVSFPKRGPKG